MDKSLPPTYYFPNMASEQVLLEYNQPVNVSVESGELLGLGHFVGAARINRATGGPRWSGDLHTSIDPLVLIAASLRVPPSEYRKRFNPLRVRCRLTISAQESVFFKGRGGNRIVSQPRGHPVIPTAVAP